MTDQMRRDDPTNLAGISSVLGDDSLGEIDLLGLEKEIVNGRVVDAVTIDYSDQYASQIEKLTRTMAVDDGMCKYFLMRMIMIILMIMIMIILMINYSAMILTWNHSSTPDQIVIKIDFGVANQK